MVFSKRNSLIPAHLLVLAVFFTIPAMTQQNQAEQQKTPTEDEYDPYDPDADLNPPDEEPEEIKVDPSKYDNMTPATEDEDLPKGQEVDINWEENEDGTSLDNPDAYQDYTSIDYHTETMDGGTDLMALEVHNTIDTASGRNPGMCAALANFLIIS